MRALFLIPKNDPPVLEGQNYSKHLKEFIAACCKKDPAQRATLKDLLRHKLVRNAKKTSTLMELIAARRETAGFEENGGGTTKDKSVSQYVWRTARVSVCVCRCPFSSHGGVFECSDVVPARSNDGGGDTDPGWSFTVKDSKTGGNKHGSAAAASGPAPPHTQHQQSLATPARAPVAGGTVVSPRPTTVSAAPALLQGAKAVADKVKQAVAADGSAHDDDFNPNEGTPAAATDKAGTVMQKQPPKNDVISTSSGSLPRLKLDSNRQVCLIDYMCSGRPKLLRWRATAKAQPHLLIVC